jgi:hypothetical protein
MRYGVGQRWEFRSSRCPPQKAEFLQGLEMWAPFETVVRCVLSDVCVCVLCECVCVCVCVCGVCVVCVVWVCVCVLCVVCVCVWGVCVCVSGFDAHFLEVKMVVCLMR